MRIAHQREKQNDGTRENYIINSFIANTSRKDRIFCPFNHLYAPCGSGENTFCIWRDATDNTISLELCLQTD